MKRTDELLDEILVASFEDLHSRSTEGVTVDELAVLYKLKIEEMKVSLDANEKELLRLNEENFKREQIKEQKKDRYTRLGIDTAAIIMPIIFYGVWMREGFKFEETGTFTSGTFRNLFGRFRPTK